MNKNIGIIIGILAVVVIVGGIYASTNNKKDLVMTQKDSENGALGDKAVMAKKDVDITIREEGTMMKSGSYETYSPEKIAMKAATGNVVLFFHASWCPTCRALDNDIKSNLSSIPANLTILDVDYDNSSALKQKYGVTVQHTLVEVDKDGKLIKKWLGSPTLSSLVTEVI